jgi:hypothetical protein
MLNIKFFGIHISVHMKLDAYVRNLSAEEMPSISLGWKAIKEQTVSSCAPMLEAGKAEGDCLMDELKTLPDQLVEDKYVTDYPIHKQKTEPDKHYN